MRIRLVYHILILFCVTFGFTVLSACTTEKSETFQSAQVQGKEGNEEMLGHTSIEKIKFTTTIYSMDLSSYAGKNVNKIPFYSVGKIDYLTEDTVKSFNEGHHPWLGHAETFISIKAANLVPDEYKEEDGIKSENIKIKALSDVAAIATITLGSSKYYEITIESSENTGGIFYITNIVLNTTIDEQPTVISQLEFEISGKIDGLEQDYFFYLVEDGHGFLADGKIVLQKNGEFKTKISIKPPTNDFGQISFYSDVNQNGEFDIEMDTQQKINSYDLVYDKPLVVSN